MTDEHILIKIRQIARDNGISPTVLEKAWRNQFKVLRDTIVNSVKDEPDTFKTVYIKYMGKFIPNKEKIKIIAKYNKEKRDREGKADS